MIKRGIFKDERARIPFSVIGIFLILGSSFTTVYVTKLETEKSEEIAQTIDFNEVEGFLRLAEADMATALNLAGLKGLKEIGERPVIEAKNTGDHDFGDDADEINRNRVKSIIMDDMNVYFINSYQNNVFNNGRYAINVIIPEGEQKPIISRDEITFNYINMELKRSFTIDLIGPPEKVTHRTYWMANLPVEVVIVKVDGDSPGGMVTNRTIDVSTLITCRYNLLKSLVDEFQDEISGVPSSLWTVCTILFNIYSMARGYQHWSSGDPANVVDNRHLHLMINTGLLLQQGFVFGSVDPMALVELAVKSGGSSDGSKQQVSDNFENGITEWSLDTSSISGVIPDDDGSGTPTLDITPEIDIEEIAAKPLYNCSSVVLTFLNPSGNEVTFILSNPSENDIKDFVEEKIQQGYTFIDSEKNYDDIDKNQSTVNHIKKIISTVYTADMETQVERGNDLISNYESLGYTIDTSSTPWVSTSYTFNGSINKPPKGTIQAGDILYGEFYYVKNEEVFIKIVLKEYSSYDGLKNDVKDIFYRNDGLNDKNLQDTIDIYKNQVLTSDNLTTWLDDKDVKGMVNSSSIQGSYKSWVETEAWQALNEIYEEITKIEIDPSITIDKYPNAIDLMNAAKDNLLQKYEENMSSYLNENEYKDGSLFISTGKKAVFCVRKWYVNMVHDSISNYFSSAENKINQHINDQLDGTDVNSDDVQDVLSGDAMSSIQNHFTIPMGYDLSLSYKWKESIRIAIDQKPDYLDPYEKITINKDDYNLEENEEFYPLKIRNTCTLGPTGIPILPPTPVTPWIFTFNLWLIEIKGEYQEFKVLDTTDETHFNPLLGHEAQIYVRRHEAIKNNGITIGENTRLDFDFITVAMAFVPPFNFMVGDTAGGIVESTPGFN